MSVCLCLYYMCVIPGLLSKKDVMRYLFVFVRYHCSRSHYNSSAGPRGDPSYHNSIFTLPVSIILTTVWNTTTQWSVTNLFFLKTDKINLIKCY